MSVEIGGSLPPRIETDPSDIEQDVVFESHQFIVGEDECDGHFEGEGKPKLMPVFRMLQRHFRQVIEQGREHVEHPTVFLPVSVRIDIDDILPKGIEAEEHTYPLDKDEARTDFVGYGKGITIQSRVMPHHIKDIGQAPIPWKHQAKSHNPGHTLADRQQVGDQLPWGKNIQFVDAIIDHTQEKVGNEGVIAQGMRRVYGQADDQYPDAYLHIHADNEKPSKLSDGWVMDPAQMLDGFAQLTYYHFQENFGANYNGKSMTPFFQQIDATFNYDYTAPKYDTPKIGEPIHYQLMEMEFTNESKTSAKITGRVVANDRTTVLAEFNIQGGVMADKQLARSIKIIEHQAKKPTQPKTSSSSSKFIA